MIATTVPQDVQAPQDLQQDQDLAVAITEDEALLRRAHSPGERGAFVAGWLGQPLPEYTPGRGCTPGAGPAPRPVVWTAHSRHTPLSRRWRGSGIPPVQPL